MNERPLMPQLGQTLGLWIADDLDLAILNTGTEPIDTTGYDVATMQFIHTDGTISGVTITAQRSNDGRSWVSLSPSHALLAAGMTDPFTLAGFKYLRGVVTTINGAAARGSIVIHCQRLNIPLLTVTGGSGRLLARTVLTSGTSHTTNAAATKILVQVQAAGGGGGGITTGLGASGCGGGGAAGGYAEKLFNVTPSTAYTYAIGTAGTGGTAGNTGTTGGNSTFAVGGTTVTANGGPGGVGAAASGSVNANLGGASPAISTNGDVNSGGMPGTAGFTGSVTSLNVSGNGGSCLFGAGGNGRKTQGNGNTGVGYGFGGGGGASVNNGGNATGGDGGGGIIVVWEFSQ